MKILLVNIGSNMTLMMVKLVITFVMTPVIVHNLGNYDYGVWEIIGAFLGYMGLLDMGMKPAISRFAAKYMATKEPDKLQELYSTSFVFLALVGLMLCLFFVAWALSSMSFSFFLLPLYLYNGYSRSSRKSILQ